MAAARTKLKSGFRLGGEQAEADALLDLAYYITPDFDVITSRADPRCFVVGRTGSGKSAALKYVELEHASHVIRINPEDLSLPYITDLQVIRYLDSLDVNLDLFWIALWKHVLIVEIIRHRYKVDSPDAKARFLEAFREKWRRDPGKRAALEYLNEFEGKFWCEADERVREITDNFTEKFGAGAEIGASAFGVTGKAKLETSDERSVETRSEIARRFQNIVNQTQLARLNKMIEALNDDILDDQNHMYIIIDDLDRDWVDERLANDLIRCLFRTVLDCKRVENLKILVALRTNIFRELDFSRRGSGQQEKFRSLVLDLRWTGYQLRELLDARVSASAKLNGLSLRRLDEILPNANQRRGDPADYILERTLMRPRDAIAFVNQCLNLSSGKARISWDDIKNAEAGYSHDRLLALRDEWAATYPGIFDVLCMFRKCPAQLTRAELGQRLDEAMLLLANPEFPGTLWLTDLSERMWTPGDFTWFELYQPLLALLYSIGFLGCLSSDRTDPVFVTDDPLFLNLESNMDKIQLFRIHQTYQAALDVPQPAGRR